MGKQTHDSESDRVDAAFNRVLAAEVQAREQVEACRRQAAALLSTAEERARRIVGRADRRLRRAHRIADAGVARVLADLKAGGSEMEPEDVSEEAVARLDQAIDALVSEIIGPESQGPS
jgi:vacuolar-type H+-ATPase subunit H